MLALQVMYRHCKSIRCPCRPHPTGDSVVIYARTPGGLYRTVRLYCRHSVHSDRIPPWIHPLPTPARQEAESVACYYHPGHDIVLFCQHVRVWQDDRPVGRLQKNKKKKNSWRRVITQWGDYRPGIDTPVIGQGKYQLSGREKYSKFFRS